MGRRAVVIGAGITGTLTSVRLSQAGWDVVLLEAAHVGAGSSSRTAAGIRQQFSTPETVLGMRYSVDIYRRFPEEMGGLVVPIVENGYLFLEDGPLDSARARVKVQRECGLHEVELLTPDEVADRFPAVSGDGITGATWCPSDGFLRPEVVYGEAAAGARARGVRIVQGARVDGARHVGGRLSEVRAKGEWFGADLFIDATNIWSPRLARVLHATPLPIDPVKRYLWFIGRGEAMEPGQLLGMPMIVTPCGAYGHPENAETLMTGWALETPAEPDFAFDDQDLIAPGFSHKGGVEGPAYDTWFALAEHIPALADFAGIQATTCGFYGVTPDHNPFMDFDPAVPNLIRLVGYSGHGAMFGPFSARVAQALAEAGASLPTIDVLGRELSLSAFAIGRKYREREELVI